MPYRTDREALNDAKASLELQLAELRAHTRELEALRAREAELERALADVEKRIGAAARPGPLERMRVASPCAERWDAMAGDARVRFCGRCEKNVYNLSAMPREEAERFVAEHGGSACVRFFRRTDGTVMTEDCPVGAKKKRRKLAVLSAAGASAMAFAGFSMAGATMGAPEPVPMMGLMAPPTMGEPTMGEMVVEPEPAVTGKVAPPAPDSDPEPGARTSRGR